MADELLPYYEKELTYIRQMGAEFAADHPKIAGRLGINGDTIEDPHVSRLIEGFAYLNARIRKKLDDEFPELTDAMLGVLYPHYQRPIPSMSIVQFAPDVAQLGGTHSVPAGTALVTDPVDGTPVRYRTAYPVELIPVRVAHAAIMGRPFVTPGANSERGAGGVIHIRLELSDQLETFGELEIDALRFYLKGQPQHVNPLYQYILRDAHSVVLARSEDDVAPIRLNRSVIHPVGFGADEGLLPYPASSFLGYRLLTEFFAFPEKFMFFDLKGLGASLAQGFGRELNLYIYVDRSDVELERNVDAGTFQLGCTPVINLFRQTAEPLSHCRSQVEYPVMPDARHPLGFEVYSVERVSGVNADGELREYLPFYGVDHGITYRDQPVFWQGIRREAQREGLHRDDGTDVFLSFAELDLDPCTALPERLEIETTCSNRDLPAKLPFGIDQPRLTCEDGAPPTSAIRCLTQPTAPVRPPLRERARWRLISHLNLNHLSLTGGADATTAVREILRLYDFRETRVTQAIIDSIASIQTTPVSAPITIDGHATLSRGTEIELQLDSSLLSGTSPYLYASILERFFALYCSINSFTRLIARIKGQDEVLKQCPPQAGERSLL